jgi:hypothetical protein
MKGKGEAGKRAGTLQGEPGYAILRLYVLKPNFRLFLATMMMEFMGLERHPGRQKARPDGAGLALLKRKVPSDRPYFL